MIAYTLVNEAIMLSDMYQINEFIALDLLTVGKTFNKISQIVLIKPFTEILTLDLLF